jgi:hypothetical protein
METKVASTGYGVQLAWLSIVLTLVIGGGGGFLLSRLASPTETFRYRLTLVADVNGETVTGSGVFQETIGKTGPTQLTGEAVTLDLGQKRLLFLIFPGVNATQAILNMPLRDFPLREGSPLERARQLVHDRPHADVPFNQLPVLVHFRNIADRTSIEVVNPANLAKTFGGGVTLYKATIEITDDPVTTGLEAKLPWLADLKKSGRALDGSPIGSAKTVTSTLSSISFEREGFWQAFWSAMRRNR